MVGTISSSYWWKNFREKFLQNECFWAARIVHKSDDSCSRLRVGNLYFKFAFYGRKIRAWNNKFFRKKIECQFVTKFCTFLVCPTGRRSMFPSSCSEPSNTSRVHRFATVLFSQFLKRVEHLSQLCIFRSDFLHSNQDRNLLRQNAIMSWPYTSFLSRTSGIFNHHDD